MVFHLTEPTKRTSKIYFSLRFSLKYLIRLSANSLAGRLCFFCYSFHKYLFFYFKQKTGSIKPC